MKNIVDQLQRSMSLLVTTPSPPTPQAPASSTPSLASSCPKRDIGQRCEDKPFWVVLEQRVSGVGLLLGRGVSSAVVIKYLISFGSAAKEGTLR